MEVLRMPMLAARTGGLGATLRRRWWVLPIVLLLVVAGLALRALTAPLAVSASVADGDRAVVRHSAVVMTFNHDMDVASVKQGFHIAPAVPYRVVVKNPRTFEFHAELQPDTGYRVQVSNARKGIGFGTENYNVAFHTEPAPKVTGAGYNDAALADGQQAVALHGSLKVTFSQPMDAARTPLLLDGAPLDGKTISWDKWGLTASVPLSLSHSKAYTLLVPKTAANRKQDTAADECKLRLQ